MQLAICQTAEDGIALFKQLAAANSALPDIIFLDINMPMMTGWECLTKLKGEEAYSPIPVIMYSTSTAKSDIDKSFELGASLFISKPENFQELTRILAIIAINPLSSLPELLAGSQHVKSPTQLNPSRN